MSWHFEFKVVDGKRYLYLVEKRRTEKGPRNGQAIYAPEEFIARRLRQIVGTRLRPHTLLGVWRLDQERGAADQRGAAQGLREVDGRPGMAKRMLRPSS